jgi:hypothetical protein
MQLPRLHLLEIHEQDWCPASLRLGLTDQLFTAWAVLFWKNTLPHMRDLLRRAQRPDVVDLCSGSGGPVPLVATELAKETPGLRVSLSDLHPQPAWKPKSPAPVRYLGERVDATNVARNAGAARTLFESFHHFRPEDAVAILSDAVRARQPIAIFEFQRRELLNCLLPPLSLVWLVGVFLQFFYTPFRWSKLVWTLIPILPLILAVDATVSVLRTYTPEELAALAERAGTDGFRWEVRQSRGNPWRQMTCLIGWPDASGGVEIVEYKA